MEHWHLYTPSAKAFKESHPGGNKRHSHAAKMMVGYGRTRDSVTVKLGSLGARARKVAKSLNPRLKDSSVIGYPFTDRLYRELR